LPIKIFKAFSLYPKKNYVANFHKDPADRIIVATARVGRSQLVAKDQKIIDYPFVATVW
jgi:PIN domain nuclease of toxin-antitoxin system